jgi:hypothetical protein
MAIGSNLFSSSPSLGGRLALSTGFTPPAVNQPAPAPAPAPPAAPVRSPTLTFNPGVLPTFNPGVVPPPIFQPPIFVNPGLFLPPLQNKTTTQLANSAITQLTNVATASATQALNAIKSKSLDGPGLIPYLERKVRVGEVLNDLAKDWTPATRTDFADAFSMDPNNFNNDAADSIVSIAILNDKDLEGEIVAENTPHTAPADLTDNRRIVWQSVPPGTPLNPPYVILVAVEYQDVAKAEDIVQSITSQLGTTGSGFRLPKALIQKGVN